MTSSQDERIVRIICGTIIFLAILAFLWYAYATMNPAIAIIRIEADPNMVEIAKLMNNT